MKKLAIGCLVVLVVLGLAGSLATFYLYHVVRTKIADSASALAAFKELPELERRVRNKGEYRAPESDLLSRAQVERLASVQAAVRTAMGARFAEIERRYKTLFEKKEATVLDVPEVLAAYRDLAGLWLVGKRAQVDALNAQGFSRAEYRWVRDRVYRALGLPLMSVDVSELIARGMRGEQVEEPGRLEGSVGPSGPIENQKLIEAFKKGLEENAALAIFGL
jgi:hypothetical protein